MRSRSEMMHRAVGGDADDLARLLDLAVGLSCSPWPNAAVAIARTLTAAVAVSSIPCDAVSLRPREGLTVRQQSSRPKSYALAADGAAPGRRCNSAPDGLEPRRTRARWRLQAPGQLLQQWLWRQGRDGRRRWRESRSRERRVRNSILLLRVRLMSAGVLSDESAGVARSMTSALDRMWAALPSAARKGGRRGPRA